MTCPCCGYAEPKKGKPRSLDQHRRYFLLIAAAMEHWPEHHEHQFTSIEALRKYLEMKAGWREIGAQIPLSGISKERAMMLAEAAIRGAGSYAMPVLHRDTLVIFKPKSISFARMPHLEFNALNNAVEDVIRNIIGVEPEQLLKEKERAA
jgi:hypothetical protein